MFILFTFLSAAVLADWQLQTSGTTENLNAIFFVDDAGTLGFAVGASGTLLKTTNSGSAWSAKTSSTTREIFDVLFPASTNGYIGGASGTVKKSTNVGETFADFITLATADATAEFRKAASTGNTIYIAASRGSSSNSFMLISTDSGSTWGQADLTNLDVQGVFLQTDSAGSLIVWAWGNNFSASQYEIWKNGAVVWSGSTRVRDLVMVNEQYGYAVGDSGLVLETSAGGDSGDWGTITTSTTGITGQLNSLYFLTQYFGWIVGENGASAVTADGGQSWSLYTISGNPNINDIDVRAESSGLVHAYLACDGGKIYNLISPTITNVTPEVKSQGWIGTLEVTGKGFISGSYLTFYLTGATTEDAGISIVSTSVVSSTEINALILVSPEASVGWRDLAVTNPDATTSKEVSAFRVTTMEAEVQRWTIDGNSVSSFNGTGNTMTVTTTPGIALRAYSASGVAQATLNPQLLVQYSDGSFFVENIPTTAMTTVDVDTISIDYSLTYTLTAGASRVLVFFSFEDSAGNIGAQEIYVDVASPLPQPGQAAMPGSRTGKDAAYQYGGRNFLRDGASINWRLRPGTVVYNYRIDLLDCYGRLIYSAVVNEPAGVVSSKKIHIPAASFPHGLVGAGAYTVRIMNLDNKEVLVKNQVFCVPWE